MVAPPVMMSPFGFSPFGFSPFFSPFGFGFGFGFLPLPLLLFAAAGLALTSFRSSRGVDGGGSGGFEEAPGAALCLQVACYCESRQDSLYGRLNKIADTADTETSFGLQALCADTCLALLRSSKDWLAGRTKSSTAGLFNNEVDSDYNRLVVMVRRHRRPHQYQSPPFPRPRCPLRRRPRSRLGSRLLSVPACVEPPSYQPRFQPEALPRRSLHHCTTLIGTLIGT